MRNIKLTIAYDGGSFHGWQIQPGQPTIQGLLGDLLYQLTQQQARALLGAREEKVTLYAAGRTDAGVHAWGQVANFKTESDMTPHEFTRALNSLLPPSIRIRDAAEVSQDFHARSLAQAKTYRYRIYRAQVVPPFLWRYVLPYPFPLDFSAMAQAARLFEGQHDFTSFAASTGSEEEDEERTTQRCIYRSEMLATNLGAGEEAFPDAGGEPTPESQEWVYVVRGKSFLRRMVRKMVGTLLEIGRGRMTPEDIPRLLKLGDRASSGPTAPPQGLCLHSVGYPDSVESSH